MWETIQANMSSDDDSRPVTWYALYTVLAKLPNSGQTAASWKRTITRIRKGEVPNEARAELIALALGVDRAELPASSDRLTLKILERRLELLEASLDDHAIETGQSLAALARGIAHLEGQQSGEGPQGETG